MKKYLFLTMAALTLSLALAGCSGNGSDAPEETSAAETTADTAGAAGGDSAAEADFIDIDKTIDMDIVEGTDATTADDTAASGETDSAKVKITDAKVIEYDDNDVIVVSFSFRNNSGIDNTFNGLLRASAEQDGDSLTPAAVIGVEGIACETLGQVIADGETITVQKAFLLYDTSSPVTVTVESAAGGDYESEPIVKTFNIQ